MMPLLYSAFITALTGLFPLTFVRSEKRITAMEGYSIVVFSWLACCMFGMLPYLCYSGEFTLADALFESVSGFTTTGASIISDVEALPKGMLFWRMCTCWMGGIGIVTLFSLLIPKGRDVRSVLRGVEISDIVLNENRTRDNNIVKIILSVYLLLTLMCSVSLKLTGLDWFDSVTVAMSTCSTCGFGVLNDNIAGYHNTGAELVLIVFMIISGMNFLSLFGLFAKGRRDKARYETVFIYLLLAVAGTTLVFVDLTVNAKGTPVGDTLRAAAFQVVSLVTTTGFATADTSVWPDLSVLVLITASIICGCSGSTSGGIKVDRAVILAKACRNKILNFRHRNRVLSLSVDGKCVSEALVSHTFVFLACYLGLILTGGAINVLCGLDLTTGMSAAVACVGNVGPGFGNVGSFGSYSDIPLIAKLTGTMLMMFGRLEIFPILFVLNGLRRQ